MQPLSSNARTPISDGAVITWIEEFLDNAVNENQIMYPQTGESASRSPRDLVKSTDKPGEGQNRDQAHSEHEFQSLPLSI